MWRPTCLCSVSDSGAGQFDHQHMAFAGIRHDAERDPLGDQHVVARLVGEAPEFGGELPGPLCTKYNRSPSVLR